MVIASSLPFELQAIKEFPVRIVQRATRFCFNESELWNEDIITLTVEENEDIQILFDSEDLNARLYLDALDIIPLDDTNVRTDEKGCIYRVPSNQMFVLYKGNAGFDALRVDVFKISVWCNGQWYYGSFQVLPKPMSVREWTMMKEELESEIRGLAQDIVRRNIGLGTMRKETLPPKMLYDFFVIKKHSKNVLMAMIDIAENPRNEINTQYQTVLADVGKNYTFDAETVKRYVMKSGSEPTFRVPIKTVSYDIQDNRLLKLIIMEYEKRLTHFIDLLNSMDRYSEGMGMEETSQYKNAWRDSITEFKEVALKLRKMTSIIKTKDWYLEISDIVKPYVPHSFILDSRYNILYQMYTDLKKNQIQVTLDSEFSYTWKRSSYLYEMWCYFKVCHMLALNYEINVEDWQFVFSDKVLFPFLEAGTKIKFEDESIWMEVVYDKPLPTGKSETNKVNPLFIAKHAYDNRTHNRPDIVINVYDKISQWYLGSIILECKYRKLLSFWSESSSRSSRAQLETYYNNARSLYLYDDLGEFLDSKPVKKVIVFTPDITGEGREQKDFKILIKGFKPSENEEIINSTQDELLNEINKIKKVGQEIRNRFLR